ncbi:membrane dipeptidase [Pseudogracilibacillus auburnensis]|uniref:membrane dipeptidase n=1 Tax=Pseudogracilibacillus auburnensis TaxID=1494959 RepID=UPI0027DA40EC|nr:membrane dipeptidase [Pseudogracilibacillus auburnensis]
MCSFNGGKNIGFGSDFDGIDQFVVGLEGASTYQTLINELLTCYSEEEVRGFTFDNFFQFHPYIFYDENFHETCSYYFC